MNVRIETAEFTPIIEQVVDSAIAKMRKERPADDSGKVLLDKKAASEVLSVSVSTVDRLRRKAGLPCVRLDGLVLFRPESLKAWAAAREAGEAVRRQSRGKGEST